jgi:hypothetical protein
MKVILNTKMFKKNQKIIMMMLVVTIAFLILNNLKTKEMMWPFKRKQKTTEIIRKTMNETVNEAFMSATTDCQNSVGSSQEMTINCPAGAADARVNLYNTCIESISKNAKLFTDENIKFKMITEAQENCNKIQSSLDCEISNLSQVMKIDFSGSCKASNDLTTKVQHELTKKLQEKIKKDTDGLSDAVNGIVAAGANAVDGMFGPDENIKTTDDVINKLTNTVSADFVTKMVNTFDANQTIRIGVDGEGGGKMKVEGLTQRSTLNLTTKLMAENEIMTDVLNSIDQLDIKDEDITSRGLTDIASTVGDSINKITGGIFGTWQMALGMCALVLVVCCIAFAVFATQNPDVVKNIGSQGLNKV